MQTIVLLATLVATALAFPSETYNPEYDNLNSEEIVENERLLANYAKCMASDGPCTSEAADFKKKIPEALKTNCEKCTPKQKKHIATISLAIQKKLPDLWAKIEKQQDPKGEYKKSFEDFLNAHA